jgi:GNAT superfamily N-acetyltransferase
MVAERETSVVVVIVRAARSDDSVMLRLIERGAGERFREVGLDHIADEEPASAEHLAQYARAGRSWVAVDDGDRPVGYVLVDEIDGCAHIEQISVDPEYQGIGIGRALVEHVRAWAEHTGRSAVTLTTFADVPWNGPLYAHLGFVVLADTEIGPELRSVRDDETARGVDRDMARVCMKLPLHR